MIDRAENQQKDDPMT